MMTLPRLIYQGHTLESFHRCTLDRINQIDTLGYLSFGESQFTLGKVDFGAKTSNNDLLLILPFRENVSQHQLDQITSDTS